MLSIASLRSTIEFRKSTNLDIYSFMFRIKTDIRQYKCENKTKVEKLIQNWVVRPTDLIFTDDEKWIPIGEHPDFSKTFKTLAKEEENTPDTVVTHSPYLDKEKNEERDTQEASNEDNQNPSDILKDLSSQPETLLPPIAPEGVEPSHADDEVTMMTERTLGMLMDLDPELDPKKKIEEKKAPVEEKNNASSETPPKKEEKEETSDSKLDNENNLESEKSTSEEEAEAEAPKLGRHDLPEEFFATNEIEKVDRDKVLKRDDLQSSSIDDIWSDIESEYSDTEIVETFLEPSGAETEAIDEDDILFENSEVHEEKKSQDIADAFGGFEKKLDLDASEAGHIDGYQIDFPFPIEPNEDDIKLGLQTSTLSRARRLKTYPIPSEKKYKDPHLRNFDWAKPEPPKDLSFLGIGMIFLFVIILVVLISQW